MYADTQAPEQGWSWGLFFSYICLFVCLLCMCLCVCNPCACHGTSVVVKRQFVETGLLSPASGSDSVAGAFARVRCLVSLFLGPCMGWHFADGRANQDCQKFFTIYPTLSAQLKGLISFPTVWSHLLHTVLCHLVLASRGQSGDSHLVGPWLSTASFAVTQGAQTLGMKLA